MGDIMTTLGDLAHHAYDTVTGKLSSASSPSKSEVSAIDASHHLGGASAQAADSISGREAKINAAVDAAN